MYREHLDEAVSTGGGLGGRLPGWFVLISQPDDLFSQIYRSMVGEPQGEKHSILPVTLFD